MKNILVIPSPPPRNSFSEIIHLVKLKPKEILEPIPINNSDFRDCIKNMVYRDLTDECLPYGYTEREQLVEFFSAPHGVTPYGLDEVYIFYNEAPIFRKLNIRTREVTTLPAEVGSVGFDGDTIFPSTAMSGKDGRLFLFTHSAKERHQHLLGKIGCMNFSLYEFIPETKKLVYLDGPFEGLTENIHQMAISESRFLVFLDMTLAVKGDFSRWKNETSNKIYPEEFKNYYASCEFPKGHMFLYDMNLRRIIKTNVEIPATAHVVFDPRHPNVFYVSMCNISNFNNIVIHGPGKIVKYKYEGEKITNLGHFDGRNFLRITTHKVLMAVAVYPNAVYLINCDTMELHKEVELFQSDLPEVNYPFFCNIYERNKLTALQLDIADDGEWIYLSGPQHVYYLNVESGKKVDSFKFSKKGIIASSHNCLI